MDIGNIDDLKTKNIHPKQKAGIFSNLFFCWGLPLFYKGWREDIDEDDLCKPLKAHESCRLGDKLEELWKLEKMNHDKPKLWRALTKMFYKEILFYGVLLFVLEFGLRMLQPLALGKLMDYYTPGQTDMSIEEAYMYAGFIVLASFGSVLIYHSYMWGIQHVGMKMRVACCSVVYRKSLKLSQTALHQTTVGQMINLISNDVNRFDDVGKNFHYIWAAPLETFIIMYLLYNVLNVTALAGFLLLLIFIPLQMLMGKFTSKFRLQTATKTDERVRMMNEIICGMQVIKMYSWEKFFDKKIENIRRLEIKQIKNASYLRALHVSFNKFITRISVFLCIMANSLTGGNPNAEYVYVVSSFYNILKQAMTTQFPQAIASLAETFVSMKRIQTFLLYDEIQPKSYSKDPPKQIEGKPTAVIPKKPTGVNLLSAFAKWSHNMPEYTLSNINFSANANQLVAIVGPVGSGKTSLLHVIMKEVPLYKGNRDIVGTISYASQEPWLFSGTVRQNILFGEEWDVNRYHQVVKVCALERDFEILPYGDKSIIGDRGVTLSGGQKARINLARAIYKKADIYLLDDPLSAVDTHVGKQLYEECISGYLKGNCTILVTHQIQYLRNLEKIYLIENGAITTMGSFKDIQKCDTEFSNLFKYYTDEEMNTTQKGSDEREEKTDWRETTTDEPTICKEHRDSGRISSAVYGSYLKAGGGWCLSITVFLLFVLTQVSSSGADYFINFWVNLEQARESKSSNNTLYRTYFEDILLEGEYDQELALALRDDEKTLVDQFFTTENCFYVYSAIIVSVVIFTITRSISFYRYFMNASVKLHNNMFSRVINAPMQFFNTNPAGRIFNRFSKDIGAIDEQCPFYLIDTVQIALNVLAVNCIIGVVNPYIIIPSVILGCLFYFYRVVYLSTSRNVKRLESTTKSPVFSHLNASINGLTTIRAFDAQEVLRMEFDKHQDQHSSAFFMFLGCNSTFGFWLDLHCVVYITLVTLSFFFMETETYGGNVGLAITQALSLTGMFQWGMRQWSDLENSMTSVERVVEYTNIDQESQDNKKEPHKNWPEQGMVEFKSVYLRYAVNEPYVLNNLSFKINPMEKIGIVGRTGAGKSSLIAALFRLATIEGKILIDGLNTKNIPLHNMRSKISIIPQEPVIFSGTLRSNLDPLGQYSDADLWRAVEQVGLKNLITDQKAGLDSPLTEGGSNLSVGQRQLVCLARAVVRNNKILVLDEATANVDPKTDELIQTTIRRNFAHCTVLTIAHRLHTIMDSDKVLVMDAGSAVEFAHPHELLQNTEGIFYKLVKKTGKATAEHLKAIAKASYELQKMDQVDKEESSEED